jgi:hypothetical protein
MPQQISVDCLKLFPSLSRLRPAQDEPICSWKMMCTFRQKGPRYGIRFCAVFGEKVKLDRPLYIISAKLQLLGVKLPPGGVRSAICRPGNEGNPTGLLSSQAFDHAIVTPSLTRREYRSAEITIRARCMASNPSRASISRTRFNKLPLYVSRQRLLLRVDFKCSMTIFIRASVPDLSRPFNVRINGEASLEAF